MTKPSDAKILVVKYIYQEEEKKHLARRQISSPEGFEETDWDCMNHAMSENSKSYRIWYSKHIIRFCGHGTMMKRMGLWEKDICHVCSNETESSPIYMFHCKENSFVKEQGEIYQDVLDWLKRSSTCPDLIRILVPFITEGKLKFHNCESLMEKP